MPLTEEQRAEIQQEIQQELSRIVEEWLSPKPELQDQALHDRKTPLFVLTGLDDLEAGVSSKRPLILQAEPGTGKTYTALILAAARLAGVLPSPSQIVLQPLEALEPLVRVIARAVEVLGTSEKALRWINAPVRSLGNRPPASLLDSPEGITRVEDALGRIKHGVW